MLSVGNRNVNRLNNHIERGSTPKSYVIFNESLLDSALETYGLRRSFKLGNLKCSICKQKVTRKNLRTIVPNRSGTDILCTDPYCIDEYFHLRARE